MGRATGFFKRTGSGTSAQTSGCDCRISGTRSTVAASALSPRSARPCSISFRGSASKAIRWQVGQLAQKSSLSRSQLAACANIRARVNLPTPRGPVNSSACGTRSVRSTPFSAVTIRSLPRNSENPIGLPVRWPRIACCCRPQQRLNRGQHFGGNFGHFAYHAALGVEALDGHPRRTLCQLIVHVGGILQMLQAGFEKIAFGARVAARRFLLHEFLCFARRHAQVHNDVLARQFVNVVFQVLNPLAELRTPFKCSSGGLMREIGTDVAVDENDFAFGQGCFEPGFSLEAVACV